MKQKQLKRSQTSKAKYNLLKLTSLTKQDIERLKQSWYGLKLLHGYFRDLQRAQINELE